MVKNKVRTGKHAKNLFYMSEAEKAKRRNEVFRRIICGTLAQWIKASDPEPELYNEEEINNENQNTQNLPSDIPKMKQFTQHDGDIYCSQSIQTSNNFLVSFFFVKKQF